jgi:PAS domain S-box-containing protein
MKIELKIIFVFCIVGALIGFFGYFLIYELAKTAEPIRDLASSVKEISLTSELDGYAQFIRYYDEVLTQSARNYAFTQDKKWEERYKTTEPELDKIIKTAISKGDEIDRQFFSNVDKANMKLVEMEYKSIDLVNDGKPNEAVTLLESAEYWAQKKIYEQGLRDYVARRGATYDESLVAHTQKLDELTKTSQTMLTESTQLFSVIIPVVLIVSIGLGVIIIRNITRPINDLRVASNEIANGNFGIEVKYNKNDELLSLANSFNLMSRSLKKSTTLVSSAEQKYKNLYENSPLLFRTIDLNGIVIDCNNSYANHLGYTKDDLIGKSVFETTAEKSMKEMRESLETWKNIGYVENKEVWFKRKDGFIFPTLISATNLCDENGKIIGSNTAIQDISDIYYARKKIEENEAQIRTQYEQLKQVDKIKDEFLAMITHELKTPLVPIKGYIDILLSEKFGPLNEEQQEKLDIVRSSTKSLLKIVSDLLDVQKIELGQLRLLKERQNISELINETILKLKPDAEHRGITITTDLQEISCVCDKVRIEEVIGNIITNAIDFCPQTNGKIQIKLSRENKYAKIVVKDNGVGIQKSSLDKIFVKFYQVDTSVTREHGGTGLGLSVCKGIIENHGGKIWAESEGRDKGTEIHILLPLE